MQIVLKDVVQSYGGQTLFDHLNLEIPSGKFFSLLGPSGSGKTTLLRLLAGFIRPDSGQILFGDRDVTRVPVHRRNIGIVFQDYALFPDRTVLANVLYGLRARGVERGEAERRALDMLAQVGLADFARRMPSQLSGGQKQRVAMARALVIRPELLLLDEPLSALDVKLRLELRQLIRRLQLKSGITTVFVTHDQSEALAVSDEIAVLNHGQILQLGTPREIYERPSCRFISEFLGCSRFAVSGELPAENGLRRLTLASGGIARTRDARPLEPGMELSVHPTELRLRAASGSPAPEEVPAEVLHLEYRGTTVEYLLKTPREEVRAELPSSGSEPFTIGQKVCIVLPDSGGLVGEKP